MDLLISDLSELKPPQRSCLNNLTPDLTAQVPEVRLPSSRSAARSASPCSARYSSTSSPPHIGLSVFANLVLAERLADTIRPRLADRAALLALRAR
jgi:hypothetical protein